MYCQKDQNTGFSITEKNEEMPNVLVESVIRVFPEQQLLLQEQPAKYSKKAIAVHIFKCTVKDYKP